MNLLLSAIISIVISVGSFLGLNHANTSLTPQMQQAIQSYVQESQQTPSFGTTLPIAGTTYTLAGGGVSQTATSITISNFILPQNGYKIQDSDLSDTFYITLEPGTPSRQEIVSCTTSVQNANNTATFTSCTRGLSPISPYTASTTLRFSHGGGTQVIFSNPPQLFNEYAALQNTQSITGKWTFDDNDSFRPRIDADTDTAVLTAFVTLGQLSRQAVSGASNASETVKGIIELSTAAEAAAGTSAGGTAARLALPGSLATSTPNAAACGVGCIPVAVSGKLSQSFLDLSQIFNFTNKVGIATATPTYQLSVEGTSTLGNQAIAGIFTATSTTATSTFAGNLTVSNNASTTNLRVSNNVQLPTSALSIITAAVSTTTSFAGPTTAGGSASKSIFCVAPKIAISGGWSGIPASGGNSSVVMSQSQNNVTNLSEWDFSAVCNTSAACGASTITVYALCVNP